MWPETYLRRTLTIGIHQLVDTINVTWVDPKNPRRILDARGNYRWIRQTDHERWESVSGIGAEILDAAARWEAERKVT